MLHKLDLPTPGTGPTQTTTPLFLQSQYKVVEGLVIPAIPIEVTADLTDFLKPLPANSVKTN